MKSGWLAEQRGFPGGSGVKNLPAMQDLQETRVQSERLNLGSVRKIPLEEEMATTPIFWPGQFHGLYGHQDSDTEQLPLSLPVFLPGESHVQRSLVGYSP